MTLKPIKDYFKENFGWVDKISTGKIDDNQEKAICFYNSKRSYFKSVIGGNANKSTDIKPITILLRYTKNQNTAELKAQEIYDFFNERSFYVENKRIFVIMQSTEPIALGTDENNVYEYSLELDLYIER